MPDFFISYNKADREWAEWIAWQLEEARATAKGSRLGISGQAADFIAGNG